MTKDNPISSKSRRFITYALAETGCVVWYCTRHGSPAGRTHDDPDAGRACVIQASSEFMLDDCLLTGPFYLSADKPQARVI